MLKTIKTTKQIDFFELVKGVQAGIYKHGDYRVIEREEGSVWIDLGGFILEEVDNKILYTDLFEVEVEEPITEDTVFEVLVELNINGWVFTYDEHAYTIAEIKDEETNCIHALINGRLELVWECDEE
ncbi:hypothetical protein [Jeotgalicoccus sp. S0W5]|uniref:hypothetical protein n=1 Tax=Jeotgalicoccus sp. S0W5 TaxID=2527874 RepID=UPI001414E4A2|nr:hypothetical protein [Jeotgalicoccus sp. S0W5]